MDDGTRGMDDGAVRWMLWTALRRPRALRRRRHRVRVPRRAPKMFRFCPPWSPSPPPLPLRLPKSLRKRGSASLGASPASCATARPRILREIKSITGAMVEIQALEGCGPQVYRWPERPDVHTYCLEDVIKSVCSHPCRSTGAGTSASPNSVHHHD
jgi:hypothetical protein